MPTRNAKELTDHLYSDFFARNQKKEALLDIKVKDLKSRSQSKSVLNLQKQNTILATKIQNKVE
jgi:hypothetical protein